MNDKEDIKEKLNVLLEFIKIIEQKLPGSEERGSEAMKIRYALNDETDRGCALLSVSFLEQTIEKCLSKKLIGSNKHKKNLFTFNGPLGNFSNKLSLAYSIGLIQEIEFDELQKIRQIRNIFAHSFEPITFESEIIAEKTITFKFNPKRSSKSSRKIFTSTVYYFLGLFIASEGKEFKFNLLREADEMEMETLRDFIEEAGF